MPPDVVDAPPPIQRRAPLSLFCLELGYLVALLLLFVLYVEVDGFRDTLPNSLGPLPAATPWFGAVGAVLVGITGHFFHYNDWDPSYNRWHISRPLLGGIEGPIACLLLLVTVRAASKQAPAADAAFYDAAAFLVGFAEQSFRDLITKATKVILAPGDTGTPKSGSGGAAG
jgi:hypothetical protein